MNKDELIESLHTIYTQLRSTGSYGLAEDVMAIKNILKADKGHAVLPNSTDWLSCEPNRQQLDEVCEWLPRLEYKTASLVDRQILRGNAAGWLRAWQHVLAT